MKSCLNVAREQHHTGDGRSSSSPFPPDIRMCDDTFPEGGKGLFWGGRGRLALSLLSGALIRGRRQEEKGKGSEEERAIT